MIVHTEFAQQSPEWFQARAGIPTASEFDMLVTPEFKIRTGDMPKTLLARKVAEYWLGGPLPSFNTFDMEMGQILEQEAIPWFSLENGLEVERPAFITTDDRSAGCSPDGMILNRTVGLEIKCPAIHTHVNYLLRGVLPKEYAPQVYGSLYVTGLREWRFVSYCRRFPALVVNIERDEKIIITIDEALDEFNEAFEDAKQHIIEINGGPPSRTSLRAPLGPEWAKKEFAQDPNDVPTP